MYAEAADGLAVFVTVNAGAAVIVTVAVDGGESTVPPVGVVAELVAEFVTTPASASAWVSV
ncbi:conserved hypothetical protein [Bacillus mycoides]|uniref:Uncharacterized protein n=1 Tax=Bacillus mycoides TaxID=1405 RepID=A0A653WCE0_BACMY|nr:conserved hypothetical protein [Curtobacterium sp. 8I-2]VXC11675.1 conserved hypothetical protein [Bacillus mycoides]